MNHLYEVETGRLESSTRLDIPETNPGYAVRALPDGDEDGIWNTELLAFDPRPENKRICKQYFLLLFTDAEMIAIIKAEKTDDNVMLLMYKVNQNPFIDLADTPAINGIHYLESAGLIAEGRATVILNG